MSAATVSVFVVFGPGVGFSLASETTAASELHCQSFAYQQDAQAEWEKWGPNDPWRWDPDGDGVVCKSTASRPDAAPDSAAPDAAAGADTPVSSDSGAETPWDGTHDWSYGDGQDWQEAPHPVGGVQAGAGGEAGDDASNSSPMLPLAGVGLGALLLTAGVNHRRRSESA